jgi:hypothetical protein
MATLVEAGHGAHATSLLPLSFFRRGRTVVSGPQRRLASLGSAPEARAESPSLHGEAQWTDRTVLTVIALTSVFAAILWTGIGVVLWRLLIA